MFSPTTDDDLAGRVLPFASGALVAVSWFIVIDALVVVGSSQPLDGVHTAPLVLASLGLVGALVAPYRPFGAAAATDYVTSALQCARLWMFVVMLLVLASIYTSVALHVTAPASSRLAASLVGHAAASAGATTLWVVRRLQVVTKAY